jgi:hypothetical protein
VWAAHHFCGCGDGILLLAEVLSNAKAMMMSSNVGAHSLGRMIGALAEAWLAANSVGFVLRGQLRRALRC